MLETIAFLHGKKWTSMLIKRVYFGNWLRDYSQAVDVGSLKGVNAETIRILVRIYCFTPPKRFTMLTDIDRFGFFRLWLTVTLLVNSRSPPTDSESIVQRNISITPSATEMDSMHALLINDCEVQSNR
jgi:hypothetical protein